MLTVLGGLAEFERELICARTSESRAWSVCKSGNIFVRDPRLESRRA
jgi:hypothetical protein